MAREPRLAKAYDALWLMLAAWAALAANHVVATFLYGGSPFGLTLYYLGVAGALALSVFAFVRALRWRAVALWRCIGVLGFILCSWAAWALVAYIVIVSASGCC